MSLERVLVLATALAGSFLVNLSGQFVPFNIADVAGALGASADEGSWLATVYSMGLFCGLVFASPLIATFGLRRYMAASALLFSLSAFIAASAPPLPWTIALRGLQGFAAGGFGPMAFAATFTTTAGPRLPFGVSLLALILLLPASLGPPLSGYIEDRLGWAALFYVPSGIGAVLATLAILLMPRTAIYWPGLRRDWTSLLLLCAALGATLLVLTQGTRRYWLDSSTIGWSLAIGAGAWAGFLVTASRSPIPVLNLELLARRTFAVPITLNLLFRTGFATTAFLIPQFLILVRGYRPVELGELYIWAAVPQLLAYPLTWWLLQRIDRRLIISSGLLLFGLSALLAAGLTSDSAAAGFRLAMSLAGVSQVLFLVPILVAGGMQLKPADGPTVSLLFNATTLGGTSIGVGLATELVTERQEFHLGTLAESASAYGSHWEQIESRAAGFASWSADEAIGDARSIATVAGVLRREAWVLSFDDGFLLVGALLIASVAGVLLLHRQPPLGGSSNVLMRGTPMTLSKSAVAALLVAVLVFAGSAYGLVGAASARGTDNAYVRGDVTPVSTKVSGVVAQVLVSDNQEVRAGDILFRLDDRDYRARVDRARAALSARRAAIVRLDRSLELQRATIGGARAAVRAAGAEAEHSGRELARIQVLRGDGWVTKSRSDEASAASEKALAGVSGAEAALDASHDQFEVIASQRLQLLADVEVAQAELRLAQLDLESTVVRAPTDGRVAERQARQGQYVRPGTPLIALVSREVWIVANFKETDIREMRVGEPVSVMVDSQPGRVFAGGVDSLSPASGAQFALLPPDNATGNFTRIAQRIPIRIMISAGQPGFEELRPGMSARVARAQRHRAA